METAKEVTYTEEEIKRMERFVQKYFNMKDVKLEKADEATRSQYKEYVEALCAINNICGLRCKAYACYGEGNAVYRCDWKVSEECLIKLVELDNDYWAANSLGYIYYYGRTTDNVPDYERAFKYFSVAALYGIHEAIYKIADLCLKGQGVPMRCLGAAENILNWMYYNEVKPQFLQGNFRSKFADVAWRMGRVYLSKAQEEATDTDRAYRYYLEAAYALKRRAKYNFYGDNTVMTAIRRGLEEARAGLSFRSFSQAELEALAVHDLLGMVNEACKLSLEKKGKQALLTVTFPTGFVRKGLGTLVVLPQLNYCRFVKRVKIDITGVHKLKLYSKKSSFTCNYCYEEDDWLFFVASDGKVMAKLKADSYKLRIKQAVCDTSPVHQLVSVEFTENGKLYDYLCDLDIAVSEGEQVVVDTYEGEKVVTVRRVYSASEKELTLPFNRYKSVLRKEL